MVVSECAVGSHMAGSRLLKTSEIVFLVDMSCRMSTLISKIKIYLYLYIKYFLFFWFFGFFFWGGGDYFSEI